MPLSRIGLALWCLALSLAAGGAVGWGVLGATLERTAPILGFAAAVTLLAELSRDAGVFTSMAQWLAHVVRGRRLLLMGAVVALAIATTTFLSLDTTAVLLTPVVIALAAHTNSNPVPFAIATVWLANTASLTLPVSNLTNLLAQDRHELSPLRWIATYGPISVAAIAATCAVLWFLFHRHLRGRFDINQEQEVGDKVQWVVACVVLMLALPLFVTTVPPWITASAASAVLLAVMLARRGISARTAVRHVPWRVLIFASGLFAVAGIAEELWIADAARESALGSGPVMAGVALLAANAINNLPAYLALEPLATSTSLSGALLIGVNFGSLVTPWASLATLLWHRQLVRAGVAVSWGRYILWGAMCVPLVVLASLGVHALTT